MVIISIGTARTIALTTSGMCVAGVIHHDELIIILHQRIAAAGGIAPLAREFGVSYQYLSDVIRQQRRIGEKILRGLGYRAEMVYWDNEKV